MITPDDQHLILQELFVGQRNLGQKMDDLNDFLRDHVRKDEHELGKIHAKLARLEEQSKGMSKKWGMVSTIVTSILSAIGVSIFSSHR